MLWMMKENQNDYFDYEINAVKMVYKAIVNFNGNARPQCKREIQWKEDVRKDEVEVCLKERSGYETISNYSSSKSDGEILEGGSDDSDKEGKQKGAKKEEEKSGFFSRFSKKKNQNLPKEPDVQRVEKYLY